MENFDLLNLPDPAAEPDDDTIESKPQTPADPLEEYPYIADIFFPGDDPDEYRDLRRKIHDSIDSSVPYRLIQADELASSILEKRRTNGVFSANFHLEEHNSGEKIDAKYAKLPPKARLALHWRQLYKDPSFPGLLQERHRAHQRAQYHDSRVEPLLPKPKPRTEGEI